MSARRNVLIAAGGTGGHTFPACALAAALLEAGWKVRFVTDARTAGKLVLPDGVEKHIIEAASPSGGTVKMLKGFAKLARGWLQVQKLIRADRPGLVVGFGGYPCFAPVLAAIQNNIPSLLHEQNAVAGRANRALGGRVTRIALTYPETQGFSGTAASHCVVTGLPVRAAIAAIGEQPYKVPEKDGRLNLLVIGGSLGATVLSEVVPQAVRLLPEALQSRLSITQQAREADMEQVQADYAGSPAQVELAPFFEDMPERLAAAQLVIGRAGASTLAELQAAGRPAIMVPYPSAADDHQTKNAEALETIGGGWLMPQPEFTPEALAEQLQKLLEFPQMLAEAADAARRHSIGNAVGKLLEQCEKLVIRH